MSIVFRSRGADCRRQNFCRRTNRFRPETWYEDQHEAKALNQECDREK